MKRKEQTVVQAAVVFKAFQTIFLSLTMAAYAYVLLGCNIWPCMDTGNTILCPIAFSINNEAIILEQFTSKVECFFIICL